MLSNWDKYSRVSLDAASTATSVGFSAAKHSTRFGFAITRGIASSVAGLTGSAIDHVIFGGSMGAGPVLGGAVSTAISAIESLTLAPILLGESLASTTLVAAQSSISVVQAVFPGSDEASFSLASFATLVRREWNEDLQDEASPRNRFGVTEVMKALVAWATLQGMTSEWQEKRWFKCLTELRVNDTPGAQRELSLDAGQKRDSTVHVTRDATYPRQIINADIGEASSASSGIPKIRIPPITGFQDPHAELKATLRRFSKLVLAGYGGASLLFFGVPPVPISIPVTGNNDDEETKLAMAIGSSEVEAAGSSTKATAAQARDWDSKPGAPSYSWWDVLRGKHDEDILLRYAASHPHSNPETPTGSGSEPPLPPAASRGPHVVASTSGGESSLMPRFWVLTDHARQEIVLVIRGTMSINELAVDLTCDPADFHLHSSNSTSSEEQDDFDEILECIPGSFPMDLSTPPRPRPTRKGHNAKKPSTDSSSSEDSTYQVHGGMLKMARAMGGRGKPVNISIKQALRRNEGYSLVICGHSLGAGVAALLALMWADPRTCLTHRFSGLPSRRRVAAYCYAPPCLVDPRLSRLAASNNLITSFVYSHDIVSRLSLGSVRDLRRAAAWLCEAEKEKRGEGYGGVTGKALKGKTGFGKYGDEKWFLSIRKTLEANMHMTHLYPPGRVLWAIRDGDLDSSHRLDAPMKDSREKVRLFDVQDVEQVFNQIVFARDMLSSHLPHQYDRVLHELL